MITINNEKFILAFANTAETTGDFSKRSNVSRSVISEIINGKRTAVRPITIGKLASALGVKVIDLI